MLAPWVDNQRWGQSLLSLPHLQLKNRKEGSEEPLGSVGEPLLSKGILRNRLHRKSIVTSSGPFFKLYCIVCLFFLREEQSSVWENVYPSCGVLEASLQTPNKHAVGQQMRGEWVAAEPFLPSAAQ